MEDQVLNISEIHNVRLGLHMFELESRDEWLTKHCFNTRYRNLLSPVVLFHMKTKGGLGQRGFSLLGGLGEHMLT